VAELEQLALDPDVAPARVLPRHPQDQGGEGDVDRWSSGAVGVGPSSADEAAVPAQVQSWSAPSGWADQRQYVGFTLSEHRAIPGHVRKPHGRAGTRLFDDAVAPKIKGGSRSLGKRWSPRRRGDRSRELGFSGHSAATAVLALPNQMVCKRCATNAVGSSAGRLLPSCHDVRGMSTCEPVIAVVAHSCWSDPLQYAARESNRADALPARRSRSRSRRPEPLDQADQPQHAFGHRAQPGRSVAGRFLPDDAFVLHDPRPSSSVVGRTTRASTTARRCRAGRPLRHRPRCSCAARAPGPAPVGRTRRGSRPASG
jgi:hypothetical protein